MAAIDYSIPGQFKGIQIESPMNAMTQAMQLRNLQESSEMNALKKQEYARAREEENALRTLFASGVKPDSDEFRNQLYARAPGLAPGIEKNILDRGKAASEIRYKDAQASVQAAEALSKKLDFHQKVFNPLAVTTEDQAAAHAAAFYDNPDFAPYATKMMTREQAIAKSRELFRTDKNAWLKSQLTLSGDKILEATERREKELRDRAEKSYPAYQLSEFGAGREPLLLDDYIAQRMQPTTAAAPTTAPPASASEMVGGTGEMVTLPDGTRQTPEAVTTAKPMPSAFGADVHPLVPTLLAGGNKDMATFVQAGHTATGLLRQINDTFKEIDRLETEKPKGYAARIKALQDYIKVVSTEGPGTKISLGGITLSTEKKYGEAFAGKIADSDVKLRDAAEVAPNAAATANRVLSILQSGQVFTGSAANIKLQMAKFLKLGGGSDSEAIANTEVLISSLADTTLGAIRSSGLGSGQGFTDKDREFLERAKAGQITYDAKSLKDLAELAHKAAVATADKWNKRVKSIPQSAIEGTGISTEPVTVSPLLKSGSRDKTPATNNKGWKLEVDASGNRAYVSPDRKQFEEVK
jgi:hypothetical protein